MSSPSDTSSFEPSEKISVKTRRIACDGGGGALGHPRVWLEMGTKGQVECPYCDRLYVLSEADSKASTLSASDSAERATSQSLS